MSTLRKSIDATGARYRILLVEDHDGDADLVRERLAQAIGSSFDVRHVVRMFDAVEALLAGAVDAVILDLYLPDADHLEALMRIRAVAPAVPVIVVSGRLDDATREAARRLGAEEAFSKDEANSRLFSRSVLYVIEHARARSQHAQMEQLLAASPDAMLVVDLDGVVRYVNPAALALFGRTREDFVGELLGFSVSDGEPIEITVPHPRGERTCEMRVASLAWQGKRARVASIRDLTQLKAAQREAIERKHKAERHARQLAMEVDERKRAEADLRVSAARVHDLYDNAPCGYHSLDENGVFVQINRTELSWLGYARGEIVDLRRLIDLLLPESRSTFAAAFEELKARGSIRDLELLMQRKDGSTLPVLLNASAITDADGNFIASRSTVHDISERRRAEQHIHHLAHHDALTGLPNRLLFRDRVDQLIRHAQRRNERIAVLMLDLDDFRQINDSLGHQVGDQVLQGVAVRLQRSLRDSDTVARWGGDEFVISVPNVGDADAAGHVGRKIVDALREPFRVGTLDLHVEASVGIAMFPADGHDVTTLMRTADTAMYHAKNRGGHCIEFFTPELSAAVQNRMALAAQLRQAVANAQFHVVYQPQFDLRRGRIYGAEALLRWTHPETGLVPPMKFIPVAEETGLIQTIGAWTLRESCRELRRWIDAGHTGMRLAVNVSVRQFHPERFEDTVERILAETGVPAAALELEITESLLMQSSEGNLRTLRNLSDMGVRLTVDDFGIGYSSLAYLQSFPIGSLKIDRSFVASIGCHPQNGAIAAAVIAMARNLHLGVIAEGVERPEQAAFLRSQGCVAAQGFLFSPPVTGPTMREMLTGGVCVKDLENTPGPVLLKDAPAREAPAPAPRPNLQ